MSAVSAARYAGFLLACRLLSQGCANPGLRGPRAARTCPGLHAGARCAGFLATGLFSQAGFLASALFR